MTRHQAMTFQDTLPVDRPGPRACEPIGQARHRALLLMACVVAGVGSGTALKQQAGVSPSAKYLAPLRPGAPVTPVQAQQVPLTATTIEAQQIRPEFVAPMSGPEEIRAQLRWISLQQGRRTLDARSRLLLARSAAHRAALQDVGLDYRDVYGVIHAESSWLPREGLGKNGVTSHGLAQFEPATARAVGLRDPADPVEAVHAAAVLLKEAARWSARRLEGLNLDAAQRAMKLREGVSVYYNLSTRGRNAWQGLNSQQMPIETRLHIRNVRDGALRAGELTGEAEAPVLTTVAYKAPAPQVQSPRDAAPATPARTRPTPFSVPQRAPTPVRDWIRTKDSITLPEGSIRWSSPESRAPGG